MSAAGSLLPCLPTEGPVPQTCPARWRHPLERDGPCPGQARVRRLTRHTILILGTGSVPSQDETQGGTGASAGKRSHLKLPEGWAVAAGEPRRRATAAPPRAPGTCWTTRRSAVRGSPPTPDRDAVEGPCCLRAASTGNTQGPAPRRSRPRGERGTQRPSRGPVRPPAAQGTRLPPRCSDYTYFKTC